ncbi:DNA cytosine methyltransferase [Hydrogenophaga sp.]|uniref:DNA cytosine methyltransferase n=1 Tax=Hydrogenophaga sp. TaxID=1904254 RepID=UPI0025BF61F5|nr:DNA cytosine methyltransferase [Hydrogenophaga sp.]
MIDLFAGPGGLGEGFASLNGGKAFKIAVSAEMEESAHRTLSLRAFFRHVRNAGDEKGLKAYYDFCHSASAPHPSAAMPTAWAVAQYEAQRLTLGEEQDNAKLDHLLRKAKVRENDRTVLIGGPPCQAYSLVGRSRNRGKKDYVAEEDHRHFLYREYLRVVQKIRPAVFVMENVKGILTAKVNDRLVFHDILRDMAAPSEALGKSRGPRYRIHSLVNNDVFEKDMNPQEIDVARFIIESEKYGIPQCRHRVILLGVREDLMYSGGHHLTPAQRITLQDAISDLPPLRSRLSKGDGDDIWREEVHAMAERLQKDAIRKGMDQVALAMRGEALNLGGSLETGSLRYGPRHNPKAKDRYHGWIADSRLDVWLNHEARSHMASDLARYFYVASFGKAHGRTPKGHQSFTLDGLAPNHKNWESGHFIDRFRVQLANEPSTTVTSHIAKDGHYFVHPDGSQCRSLTVREAARLQSFPDNYFFQGNRTQQYHQVGNAVPSLLASQIAAAVKRILNESS